MAKARRSRMETKTANVLAWLKTGRTLTTWQAIAKFRATRLSAIIHRLRKTYAIRSRIVRDPGNGRNFHAVYKMVG